MATRAPFLNQRYGGYYHSDIPKEDEELTHVGPGTSCGEYLRRFWHPITTSDDLKDLPLALRIMGEDLVAFRDKKGRVGLLELHCTHRGTSLEYGQIEEEGIRCCYHGWLFGYDGAILDTPGEPPESTFKDRLCQGAYPTHEYMGMVWAYMGPLEKQPVFPIYDTFNPVPGYCLSKPGREYWPCNWLQVKDNSMDPFHTAILHGYEVKMGVGAFSNAFQEFGTLDWMESPIGTIYMHSRRIGDKVWVRTTDFIAPTLHQIAINTEKAIEDHGTSLPWVILWLVPVDDTHSTVFTLRMNPGDEPKPARPAQFQFGSVRPYEEMQRVPGDYEAQMSQRPIAVHGMEHLGTTDRGVIMLRRTVRRGIEAVRNGETPEGIIRTTDGVIPTYAGNTVVHCPPAASQEEDRKLLLEVGQKVGEGLLSGTTHRSQSTL